MSNDDMTTVELGQTWHQHSILRYEVDEVLEPGDTIGLQWLEPVSLERAAEVLARGGQVFREVPHASFSVIDTGHGDFVGVSNVERLVEDYGRESFVHYTGGYGTEGLMLLVGSEVSDYLLNDVMRLDDYPLYDDDDHSRREAEALDEELADCTRWAVFNVAQEREGADEDELRELMGDLLTTKLNDGEVDWYRAEDVDLQVMEGWLRTAYDEKTGRDLEEYARTLIPSQPEVLPGL